MRADTLIQQHPPTPPNAGAEYQAGLQQVAQFNADRSYSFEAGYSSPRSVAHQGIPSRASHADDYDRGLGTGLQYNGYGSPTGYHHGGSYDGISNDQTPFSPPTPRSANGDEPNRRVTRSGRAVAAPKSPKAIEVKERKILKPKSRKTNIPKLIAPLSELTKEFHDVPVKDMEKWVRRTADDRRREVEKKNGYITRPMNSFMLYRSAFAERAKAWCSQNNHQVVSSVAGASWPLEPPEIRELYNELAKLERINHQNAHPTYKFSPSKTTALAKRGNESSDEEPSDSEDAERTSRAPRPPPRPTKRLNRSISYPSSGDYIDGTFGPNPNGVNKSSWDMTNRGPMPLSTPMSQHGFYSPHFEFEAYPMLRFNPNYPGNMYMTKFLDTPNPLSHLQSNPLMIGLPGGNADDQLLELHPNMCTSVDEGQVDPTLLAYGDSHSDIDPTSLQHGQISLQEAVAQHNLDDLLDLQAGDYQAWQSDPTLVSFEQESEFDKWIAD